MIFINALITIAIAVSVDPLQQFTPKNDSQSANFLSVCGKDQTNEIKCFYGSRRIYKNGKAVLRTRKGKSSHCTAWLVGDEGHVLTNYHCAKTVDEAESLRFEAMAEGRWCRSDCRTELGCKGKFIHTKPLQFIATGGSRDNDWTLLRVPKENREKVLAKYGYARIRASGPVAGEQVYVIGHPNGYGKRISYLDGNDVLKILSTTENTSCGTSEVIYRADTDEGSSGSPVFGAKDGLVVAMHHCGGCEEDGSNSAINIKKLDAVAKKFLPKSAYA